MKIIRDIHLPTATLGRFDFLDILLFTLERPWVPYDEVQFSGRPPPCGKKGVSCVPPGIYTLEPHDTEAHPNTVALINPDLWVYHWENDVPPDQKGYARTCVLIHPANRPEELRGCIAPGTTRDIRFPSIWNSRRAFSLLHLMELELEIGEKLEIVDG